MHTYADFDARIIAMKKRTVSLAWLAGLTGLLALTACDSATNADVGTVRLYLATSGASTMLNTATRVDFGDVTSATVTISRAELMPGHEVIDLGASEVTFNLLDMQGDATALLGAVETLGEYEQLRLIVSGASVTLTGETEPRPLRVPSGAQTGVKVNFGGPIEVGPGAAIDLLAVFEVDESFVFQGPPDAPRGVSFKPVIHASTVEAASISGSLEVTLATAQTTDSTVPVTVDALLGTDVMASATIPVTVAAGSTVGTDSYNLRFLQPGLTYTVRATAANYTSTPVTDDVLAAAGVNAGPDFSLAP